MAAKKSALAIRRAELRLIRAARKMVNDGWDTEYHWISDSELVDAVKALDRAEGKVTAS